MKTDTNGSARLLRGYIRGEDASGEGHSSRTEVKLQTEVNMQKRTQTERGKHSALRFQQKEHLK